MSDTMAIEIIEITKDNVAEISATCFMKKDSKGYQMKEAWITERFKESLRIKILRDGKKTIGFIEYISGEYAWRSVDAKGYLFIHCIWITPNKYKNQGYATQLIHEVIKDAKGTEGVCVITSDDSFMADKSVFLKNNFTVCEEDGKHQLLVKQLKKGKKPYLKNYKKQLLRYTGWNILYSKQCPWVARFIDELDKHIIDDLKIKIIELKTARQAQDAPSIYSTFNLIKDGKLLADHYISMTRFKNIINKNK
jgi:hypothetical protein